MKRTRRALAVMVVALCCAILLAACGTERADTTTTTPGGEETTVTTMPDRSDRTPTSPPETVPPDLITFPPVTGEVPADLLEPVVADAAVRAGVAVADTTVITGQEMVWSDGSLGCPEPGVVYTQAQVPGYWVVVEAAGAAYDYRLKAAGSFRLCTSPGLGGTSPTS